MRGLPSTDSGDSCRLYEEVQYEEFWEGLAKRRLDELERAIITELLPAGGRRFIDVGCGYGRLADCYVDRFSQVFLLDGSQSLLGQARRATRGRAVYVAADAVHLPFRAGSFDAALMVRVFHHVADSRACLSELHRVLCRDGRLVFNFSNKRNALRIAKWLLRSNADDPFALNASGVGSTFIHHHPRFVHELLREVGFSHTIYRGAGVMDKVAQVSERLGRRAPLGKALSPFFGLIKVAPWMFCSAVAEGHVALREAGSLEDVLQCPACGGNLSRTPQAFDCVACQRHFPVDAGIIDFRVD